jgi:hypothetical protein
MPGSEQDMHPQSDGMVECYFRMVGVHLQKVGSHQRVWDARSPIFLLAYRASTHNTMDLTLASLVFVRELWLYATCCLASSPEQGMTHNWSRDKFSGPSTCYPQLCPTPEAGQWPDENSLWHAGQLCGLPWGWQSVALLSNPHRGEIAQAPILGSLIWGSHPAKWCGIQDPAEP